MVVECQIKFFFQISTPIFKYLNLEINNLYLYSNHSYLGANEFYQDLKDLHLSSNAAIITIFERLEPIFKDSCYDKHLPFHSGGDELNLGIN